MRVFIVGGTGFVGVNLANRLRARGDEVTVHGPSPGSAARAGPGGRRRRRRRHRRGRLAGAARRPRDRRQPRRRLDLHPLDRRVEKADPPQPHPHHAQRRRRAAGDRRRHARLDLRRRVLRLPRRRGTRRGRRARATIFSPASASTGRPRRCAPASGARAWRSPASGSSSARAGGCSGRWRRSSARSSAGRSARAGSGFPGSTSRTSSGRWCTWSGRPESSGAYNLTAPEPVTNRTLTRELGRVLHRPAFLPAPGFAVRLALGEFGDVLLKGQRVLPRRLLAEGFRFAHPGSPPRSTRWRRPVTPTDSRLSRADDPAADSPTRSLASEYKHLPQRDEMPPACRRIRAYARIWAESYALTRGCGLFTLRTLVGLNAQGVRR